MTILTGGFNQFLGRLFTIDLLYRHQNVFKDCCPRDCHRPMKSVQPQIRMRRPIRVCSNCLNYKKIRVKWDSLKCPIRTSFPAYTERRQSTHQCYQCFDSDTCIKSYPQVRTLQTKWLFSSHRGYKKTRTCNPFKSPWQGWGLVANTLDTDRQSKRKPLAEVVSLDIFLKLIFRGYVLNKYFRNVRNNP